MFNLIDCINQPLIIEVINWKGKIAANVYSNKMGTSTAIEWNYNLHKATAISFEAPTSKANWKVIYRRIRILFSSDVIEYGAFGHYPYRMPREVARRIFGGETFFVPKGTFRAGSGS